MVVNPYDNYICNNWSFDDFGKFTHNSSLYLYTFLENEKRDKRDITPIINCLGNVDCLFIQKPYLSHLHYISHTCNFNFCTVFGN